MVLFVFQISILKYVFKVQLKMKSTTLAVVYFYVLNKNAYKNYVSIISSIK